MNDGSPRVNYVGQAWLVVLLGLLYGSALAGVQATLGPRIAENKKNETYNVIPVLVRNANKTRTVELVVEGRDGSSQRIYKAVATDGAHLGWVLPCGGPGFGDRIELLIGLDAQMSTITGLYVLDQKETPGLGDAIADESFCGQFSGKSADNPLAVVKPDPEADNEIVALTGATISSESVSTIVNDAIASLQRSIPQSVRAGSGATSPCPQALDRSEQ